MLKKPTFFAVFSFIILATLQSPLLGAAMDIDMDEDLILIIDQNAINRLQARALHAEAIAGGIFFHGD